jgi:hypothetical protein
MKVNLFIFFQGIIKRARVVNIQPILDELDEPARPEGISNRHWNLLPNDIRLGGDWQEMLAYIEGWESPRGGDTYNLHNGNLNLVYTWALGRENRRRRMAPRQELRETDVEYYHTEEFIFFDVTQIMFDPIWLTPYKHMLFRHIEDGNTVQGQRIGPDHPMWNFPDVM